MFMETKLLKASDESIALACELLKKGEVVAVPTETVYGLAGDSSNEEMIKTLMMQMGRKPNQKQINQMMKAMEKFQ